MALSIPLADTMLSIVRRFLRQQSIFTADHDHITIACFSGDYPAARRIVLYAASGLPCFPCC